MKKKMNLSDNDKREIIQLIQEKKTLPEKYRFLLFKDQDAIEILWNGKSNDITNTVLPFQIIEHVDEPRDEREIKLQGNLFDDSGRKIMGWSNKLIWGNNNLILSSLLNGPLAEDIKNQGGIKMIYIDPPFNTQSDFSIKIKVGEDDFEKKRNFLEEIAYRDTWNKHRDSFLSMIYERIVIAKHLLTNDGLFFIHCDLRTSAAIKLVLDEVFGFENYINTICWKRTFAHGDSGQGAQHLGKIQDHIHLYSKTNSYNLNKIYTPYEEDYVEKVFKYKDADGRRWQSVSLTAPGGASKGNPIYEFLGIKRYWQYTKENMERLLKENKIYQSEPDTVPRRKFYLDESKGVPLQDLWTDISPIQGGAKENSNYPTQKPEKLLKRIIELGSNENDLILDFFCGSGTTLVSAEKMNRKWIGCDLGKFAIHISRKRLIETQRENKKNRKDFRPFELLNLGKYQRESFISKDENNLNLKNNKEQHYINLILEAYQANKIDNPIFHGVKNNRYIYVGPINIHVSRTAIEEVLKESIKNKISKVDVLCFEHEQGLFPDIIHEAKEKGVDISCKIIPTYVFDKRAVENKQVVFHDVAFIEFKPIIKKNKISVELTGFSVDYSQDKIDEILSEIKPNKSKVILSDGQIIKIGRDKNGIEKKEVLTKSWKDWIDYWAVDFNFGNKKETFKVKDKENNLIDFETGDYVFQNTWQSFTSEDKDIEFISAEKEFTKKSSLKIAVKVIDIFGNDTTRILKVNL
jgi:DNA modification methylase